MASKTALGTNQTTIQVLGTLQSNAIQPYSGTDVQLGVSSGTGTIPGTLQTNVIQPASGSDVQLGSSSGGSVSFIVPLYFTTAYPKTGTSITLGLASTAVSTPGSFSSNTIYPYSGTGILLGVSTTNVSLPGTISVNTVNPNSGTNITLGSASNTTTVPGSILTNTITPSSGTDLILGTGTTNVDCPGALKTNAITTYSGTALSVGTSSSTVSIPGALSLGSVKLNTTGGTAASLDYYETATFTGIVLYNGSTTYTSSFAYQIVRVGKMVTMYFAAQASFNVSGVGDIIIQNFPSRFVPALVTYLPMIGLVNGSSAFMGITLGAISPTGVSLRSNPYGTSSTWSGQCGFTATSISWMLTS